MEFPDLYNTKFDAKDYDAVKRAVDYAVSRYENQSEQRKNMSKMYDAYNGIVDPKVSEAITKPYGKRLKTKYEHHNFGLSKVKTLVGEFLSTPIEATVETIDEDQVNKKFDKFLERKAMLDIKPAIQQARDSGYDIFPGMLDQMEDEEAYLSPKNFRTDNEVILSKYLKGKIVKDRIKLKFKQNLVDAICTCYLFGKVETVNGVDTYRRISPKNMILEEYETEGIYEDAPYIGEKRYLFKHQIIKEFGITGKEDLKKLEDWREDPSQLGNNTYQYKMGSLLYPVYTIEFKTIANICYFSYDYKSSSVPYIREINEEEYGKIMENRRRYKDYKIYAEKVFIEEVWEATRIGADMYKRIQRVEKQINTEQNRKLRARYNYIAFGMDNVEGVRVPIQFVISKLDRQYNDVMFLINKEIKKPSGSALGINMGYLPKESNTNDILTELSEDGTVRFNTAAEGNRSGIDGKTEQALTGVNIGDKGRVLDTLLRLKLDIENSIDRITGITRGRSGQELATTTATTSNNNLESSRITTYDMFYQMKEYFNEVMTRMCEKGKLNFIENNPDFFGGIFSDEEFNFIKATSDIALESFSAFINDGRKELQITEKIEGLFAGDINSGQLRSKDVARFYLADSLAEGLRVLDKAWKETSDMQRSAQDANSQAMLQKEQMVTDREREGREDVQQHDMDMIYAQGDVDQQNIRTEKIMEGSIHASSDSVKREIADKKIVSDNIKASQKAQSGNSAGSSKPKPKNKK